MALSSLPAQAAQTVRLIKRAARSRTRATTASSSTTTSTCCRAEAGGYYHEYTVPTPGASNRGTRRIITGKDGEFYYTGDHYEPSSAWTSTR